MEDFNDLSRYQDILGQLPMLQVYAHILYMFPLPKETSHRRLIDQLGDSITKVRQEVPWMGARVVNEGKSDGNSGLYRVIECPKPEQAIEVRDLRDKVAPYSELVAKKAPLSMIDPKLLTPVPGFPTRFEDSEEDPARVVRLQASLIEGGLILDFVIHHNMVDAGGHFGFVKLVAMAMRGEEFPIAILKEANRDRRCLFPLLTPDEPMLDHTHHRRPPLTEAAPLNYQHETSRYHIFRFSRDSMAALKSLSSRRSDMDSEVPFITTDDALSAFCWKRITIARSSHFEPDTRSRFSRAIDGRGPLGISPDYMGDVVHNVATWLSFQQLCILPLSAIASKLRKDLNRVNTSFHVRSFATFIAKEPDKSTITYAGEFNPMTDLGCSSIRGRKDLFPDFGELGRPQLVRRPPPAPFPGLTVMFPANGCGDCDAMICLTEKDFQALSADAEWTQYVEYIG